VTTTASPSTTASAILAAAGIDEDMSYYGPFLAEDEKAVLTVPMRIQAAWAVNDADAFAALFATNGSLLMQDSQLLSQDEIHAFMTAAFEGAYKGARVKGWPLSIKFLSDDTAVVVTEGGIQLPGETETAPERKIRATWVIVRLDGEWKLLSHQSSPI
jgi:uncharacterized protein (TIGR02246 family)